MGGSRKLGAGASRVGGGSQDEVTFLPEGRWH